MPSIDGRTTRESGRSGFAKKALDRCKKEPCSKWWRFVGSPMQGAGMPDIHGVLWGIFVAIECKREGEYPTPLQMVQLRELEDARAVVGVARTIEDVEKILERALDLAKEHGLYRPQVSTFFE